MEEEVLDEEVQKGKGKEGNKIPMLQRNHMGGCNTLSKIFMK